MKIQLDYDNKVITLEDNVSLGELFKVVKDILPEWREWKLNPAIITNWQSPIVIKEYVPRPWWQQPYYGETTGGELSFNSLDSEPLEGVFCVN